MAEDPVPVIVEPVDRELLPALPPNEIEATRDYIRASRAEATLRKYARDWDAFSAWCRERGAEPMPARPELVAVYVSWEADRGLSGATINRKVAAIGHAHRLAGLTPPHRADGGVVIGNALAGIRRIQQRAPVKKAAADADIAWQILWSFRDDASLLAARDRALLALGFAGAFRRSELVALKVGDLQRVPEGLRVSIRKSKTDQEGRGAVIAVPEGRRLKPVSLVEAWVSRAAIGEGPLFRPLTPNGKRVLDKGLWDGTVARIVQSRAAAAGLDPAQFAGHSLRAGFLTSAAAAGASIWKMQEVSRHRSVQVLSEYVRRAKLFDDHAGEGFL